MSNLPLTYTDLVFSNGDLDPFGAETTSDLQNLQQDISTLIIELFNSNLDDPNRGIGIETFLSANANQFSTLSGLIEAQVLQDDRVSACTVTTTQNGNGAYSIIIQVQVGQTVLPLEYNWVSGAGLINLSSL